MIFYPDLYLENILKIDKEILKKNDIKGILLDIDNTILYYDRTMLDGVKEWRESLKNEEIKFCILSNSNHIEKIKIVSDALQIPYVFFAKKPLLGGYKKALTILQLQPQNVAMVGDQVLTDVLGANRMKMFSILTKPLEERDIWITKVKRPVENLIIKSYLKREKTNVSK